MNRKLLAALAAVAALALAGAGAALAFGGYGTRHASISPTAAGDRAGVLQTAATYLGLSVSTIRTDLQNGQTLAQIANGVSGKSADGLIQALLDAEKTRITNLVNGTFPAAGKGFGHGPGLRVLGAGLQAAADYLGISTSQIQTDLKNGQTLAQIANGVSGKSADGLIQALVSAAKTKLDAAVSAGKLTPAQETAILSNLQQRIADVVNGTLPAHRFGGFGPGFGLGFGMRHSVRG